MSNDALNQDQAQRLDSLEALYFECGSAERLLAEVERLFPIAQEMTGSFKGHHSLTLREDGKLQLNVWIANRVWPVWFTK